MLIDTMPNLRGAHQDGGIGSPDWIWIEFGPHIERKETMKEGRKFVRIGGVTRN